MISGNFEILIVAYFLKGYLRYEFKKLVFEMETLGKIDLS